jgi:hypothetical protein
MDGNSGAASLGLKWTASVQRLTVLRCDLHHFGGHIQIASSDVTDIHNGLFIHDTTCRTAVGGGGDNIIFAAAKSLSIVGCLLEDSTAAEHVLRSGYMNPGFVGHSYLLNPATGKHTVKLHENNNTAVEADGGITQFVGFLKNRFKGGAGCAWVVNLAPTDAITDEQLQDIIVDSNWFEPEADTQRPLRISADRVTVRNNIFNLTGTTSHVSASVDVTGVEGAHDGCEFYQNTHWSSDVAQFLPIIINTGSSHIVQNDLGYAPNSTSRDMVSGAGSWSESGNTSAANILVEPKFATSNGVGTGTLANPSDFFLRAGQGSHAEGAGVESVPVLVDFSNATRDINAMDVGFDLLTGGTLPSGGGGGAANQTKNRRSGFNGIGLFR